MLTAFQFIPFLSPLPISLADPGPKLISSGSAENATAVEDPGHVDVEVTDGAHDAPDLVVETDVPPETAAADDPGVAAAAPSLPHFFDAVEGTSRAAARKALEEMEAAALANTTHDYWWWHDRIQEVRVELTRR